MSKHALIPAPPRVPGRLAQARRLISPGFVGNILRPVGSGLVQALLTHALQPSPAQMQPSPQRPLRAWVQRHLAARAAPQPDQPAPGLPDQLPAAKLQRRYLRIEVHTWTSSDGTHALAVDIVAVQSETKDMIPT